MDDKVIQITVLLLIGIIAINFFSGFFTVRCIIAFIAGYILAKITG